MFKRILVPVDGTDRSVDAIQLARHLAEHSEAHIVLMRVEPEAATDGEVFAHRAKLEEQASELRAEGLDAYVLMEYDRPEDGIAAAARYQHSDLIVMAPRHRSGLDALWRPSVTERMFAHSPSPLLVWPAHRPTEDQRALLATTASLVIVPLDGSEVAERALPYASAMAAEYDRTLLLIRIAPRIFLAGGGAESLLLEAEAQQDENRKALRYLKDVRRRILEDTSLMVQTALRVGEPAREILRLAEAHPESLIVMSTHGRGGIARFLLGSVVSEVVRKAELPVLVVPTGRELDTVTPGTIRHRPTSSRL